MNIKEVKKKMLISVLAIAIFLANMVNTSKSIADWAKPAFDYIGIGRLWYESGYLYNSGSGQKIITDWSSR